MESECIWITKNLCSSKANTRESGQHQVRARAAVTRSDQLLSHCSFFVLKRSLKRVLSPRHPLHSHGELKSNAKTIPIGHLENRTRGWTVGKRPMTHGMERGTSRNSSLPRRMSFDRICPKNDIFSMSQIRIRICGSSYRYPQPSCANEPARRKLKSKVSI